MAANTHDPLGHYRQAMHRPRAPWMDEAACKGLDPAIFYPPHAEIAFAKAICARCPVREECLVHALRYNETRGVWGGTSERQRRPMHARWRAGKQVVA